jgi:hypothetical protein
MQATDSSIKAPSEDFPAALQGLIEAAVVVFDADRDNSRSYLLRASALLRLNRRAGGSASTARSKPRGGLLAGELRRVVEYIEIRLADSVGGPNYGNGSRESHRCERGTLFPSVQGQCWRQSHSLRHHAAHRSRRVIVNVLQALTIQNSIVRPTFRHVALGAASPLLTSPIRRAHTEFAAKHFA